jgi:hypothetical protein
MAPLALLLVLSAGPGVPAPLLRALAVAPAGPERAVAATAPLVGRRYLLSPLGEGVPPDPDPRFRLDAFDCVTFVETAIALGNAADLAGAERALDDVRYDGPPAFDRRNHYVIPQWLPVNLAKGWVEDVSADVAGDEVVEVTETFDEARWRRLERSGALVRDLSRAARPQGTFRARMVPLAAVRARAGRIPQGTIAWVVREDRPERSNRVSHGGLVFVGPGGARFVRHASSAARAGRVVEEPLDLFLRRQEAAYPGWPPVGLLLVRIRAHDPAGAAVR